MSYKEKVTKLGLSIKPGIYDVEVQHDDWCTIWRTKVCNCKPYIGLKEM